MKLYKSIVITVHYSALAVYRNKPWGICQFDCSLLYIFECLEHLSRSYLSMLQESNPWRWGEKSFVLDVIQPRLQNEGWQHHVRAIHPNCHFTFPGGKRFKHPLYVCDCFLIFFLFSLDPSRIYFLHCFFGAKPYHPVGFLSDTLVCTHDPAEWTVNV